MENLEVYRALISKARKKEKFYLIDYLKYRMQGRKALFTEVKHFYSIDKLSIKKSIEQKQEKKVNFADFLQLNGQRIVLN